MPVAVEIGGTRRWRRTRSPIAQQDGQVGGTHLAVAVQIERTALATVATVRDPIAIGIDVVVRTGTQVRRVADTVAVRIVGVVVGARVAEVGHAVAVAIDGVVPGRTDILRIADPVSVRVVGVVQRAGIVRVTHAVAIGIIRVVQRTGIVRVTHAVAVGVVGMVQRAGIVRVAHAIAIDITLAVVARRFRQALTLIANLPVRTVNVLGAISRRLRWRQRNDARITQRSNERQASVGSEKLAANAVGAPQPVIPETVERQRRLSRLAREHPSLRIVTARVSVHAADDGLVWPDHRYGVQAGHACRLVGRPCRAVVHRHPGGRATADGHDVVFTRAPQRYEIIVGIRARGHLKP